MIAALLARRAGFAVRLVDGGPGCPQAAHVHILRDGLGAALAGLDPDLGARLAALTTPAHRWIGADGQDRPAPRLTRAGLVAALSDALAAADIVPETGQAEGLDPAGADLWIDATGGTRALARAFEGRGLGQLRLDDLGQPAPWVTRHWLAGAHGAPFTLVLPGRLYLEGGPDGTRATGPEGATPDLPPGMALPPGPPDTVSRMIGPPVRLAVWTGHRGTVPLILFGDARLQTPPAMGFGLMGVAQQAAALAPSLGKGGDPAPGLTDWAEHLWMGAAMQVSLSD